MNQSGFCDLGAGCFCLKDGKRTETRHKCPYWLWKYHAPQTSYLKVPLGTPYSDQAPADQAAPGQADESAEPRAVEDVGNSNGGRAEDRMNEMPRIVLDSFQICSGSRKIVGIEALVFADLADRQALGIKKYGQRLDQNPLPLGAWLQHAYEECLDQALYLRRAIEELKKGQPNESANVAAPQDSVDPAGRTEGPG